MARGGRAPPGDQLAEAAENIDRWCRYVLPRQFADPAGWELQNMLTNARLMIAAALSREETRAACTYERIFRPRTTCTGSGGSRCAAIIPRRPDPNLPRLRSSGKGTGLGVWPRGLGTEGVWTGGLDGGTRDVVPS